MFMKFIPLPETEMLKVCLKKIVKLFQHMEKPFACHLCNFRVNKVQSLQTHMRIHTGEKPFACHLCTYRSNQAGNLKGHLRRIHTGEKPFACHLCTYCSNQSGNLKDHLRRIHKI